MGSALERWTRQRLLAGDPAAVSLDVQALSDDRFDWPFLQRLASNLPPSFRPGVLGRYAVRRADAGQKAANLWALKVGREVSQKSAHLAASDDEICRVATLAANEAAGLLADLVATTEDVLRGKLGKLCARHGVAQPDCESLRGYLGRLTDVAWWRRALRRSTARAIEHYAIELGLVHRMAGVYASNETCERFAEQQRRNAFALAASCAENEQGQCFTLAELAALGVSNPDKRRAELMTRIRGFEDFARENGHIGLFFTWTCPSRMHARLSASGQENPKYDGTTPKQAAGFLAAQWAKARAWLQRRGVFHYGFRVAEPHHDGTPHWHMLLFVRADHRDTLTGCLRDYALSVDAHELGSMAAIEARFKVVVIDWARGSAAGYIAKYVCKNIDGRKTTGEPVEFSKREADDVEGGAVEGAQRVRAWASCWGIRQFQQIGGPGVTIWRELRRIREDDEEKPQGELFSIWSDADKANWHGYVRHMGGVEIAKKDRPAQLWREIETSIDTDTGEVITRKNRYGEDVLPKVKGVMCAGQGYKTRTHVWSIKAREVESKEAGDQRGHTKKSDRFDLAKAAKRVWRAVGFSGSAKPATWTRVNNCTRRVGTGWGQSLVSAYQAGPHVAREVFAALVAAKNAQVGRAFVPVNYQELKNVLQP